MTLDDFRKSLTAAKPPAGLTLALVGLWWDANGDHRCLRDYSMSDINELFGRLEHFAES
jgi:hypothetical protein